MNFQLLSINLISGPERARSGEHLIVGVEATFKVDTTVLRSAGFGIVKEETPAGLKASIEEAVAQAQEIAKSHYDPFEAPLKAVPVEALKAVAKIASNSAIANAKLKGNEKTAEDLASPADDVQQKQLNQLCNELGITPVDVIGTEKGMALCIFKALEGLLTEAKPNPDGD